MYLTIVIPSASIYLADGEHFAGLMLDAAGKPSHYLILLPGDSDDAQWEEQAAWAESIGGELPTLREQSLLFANCGAQFAPDWYWSSTQHASALGHAWGQGFVYGEQSSYSKLAPVRARAVRRVPATF